MHITRVFIFILIMLLLLPTFQSCAAPGIPSSGEITGKIWDMWLKGDRCYFHIEILTATDSWLNLSGHDYLIFNSSYWEGRSVDANVFYLNETSMKNESIPSSQGWKVGDIVSGRLWHQNDEFGEWFWFNTTSKSNINFAEPMYIFIRQSTLIIILAIGCTTSIVVGLWYRRFLKKSKS